MAYCEMAQSLTAFANSERASSDETKPRVFEFDCATCCRDKNGEAVPEDFDVIFLVGRDVLRGHQSVFSSMSSVLEKCFSLLKSDLTDYSFLHLGGLIRISRTSSSQIPKLTIDAPIGAFKPVFDFCYSHKLSVMTSYVPAVYLLSKRLKLKHLQVPCADYLAQHININNVGELCRLTQFAPLVDGSFDHTPKDDCLLADLHLARALYNYLLCKADAVACSLTGQLSARLIVNLTGSKYLAADDTQFCHLYDDVAFAVLLWAHERIHAGERLAKAGSEENVQSDDEESDGGGSVGGSSACCSKNKTLAPFSGFDLETVLVGGYPGHPRAEPETLVSTNDEDEAQLEAEARLSSRQLGTQEIRITLDMSELPAVPDRNESGSSQKNAEIERFLDPPVESKCCLRTFAPTNGPVESETCLLACSSLGVGPTSIWLGKLAGHLVSLSIKQCPTTAQEDGRDSRRASRTSMRSCKLNDGLISVNPASRLNNDPSAEADVGRVNSLDSSHCAKAVMEYSEDDADEAGITITPASGSYLARVVAHQIPTDYDAVSSPDEDIDRTCKLLEARSGAGAGLLTVDGQSHLVLLGGYTRKGCLNTIEIFSQNLESNLEEPLHSVAICSPFRGPRLNKPRGRVAAATVHSKLSHSDAIYACGGSTGSVDLASVEKLTTDSLGKWMQDHQSASDSTESSDERLNIRSPRPFTGSKSTSNSWQFVTAMHQPRSSPTAVELSSLHTGTLISDPDGSLLVAGGLTDAVPVSNVEAFIPEINKWVALPSMTTGRSEGSGCILAEKNLIVVAGGCSGAFAAGCCDSIVEALDPRCPNWMPLPAPTVGATGVVRGAALVPSPCLTEGLLLIGGFNGSDTLNKVWLFDPIAWNWLQRTPLNVARTNACAVTWYDYSGTLVLGGYNAKASKTGFLDSIELIPAL